MCEVYLSAPLCNLCEVCKLRAVIYRNGMKDLAKAVAVFITQNFHRRHDSIAGFARNADSEIVLGFLHPAEILRCAVARLRLDIYFTNV